MATSADLYNQALAYHRSGDLARAEALYRQVLQADPAHVEALHLLGILAYQTRNYQNAVALLGQVIALMPNHADAHNNLGIVYKDLGQGDLAINCYRQAAAAESQPWRARISNMGPRPARSRTRSPSMRGCLPKEAARIITNHANAA